MDKYPLIKFVIIFICGIILESIFNLGTKLLFLLAVANVIAAVMLYIYNKKEIPIESILILTAVVLTAMLHYSIINDEQITYPFRHSKIKNVVITGNVTDVELIKEERIIFYLKAESIKLNGSDKSANLLLLCTLKDTKTNLERFYSQIEIGNKIKMKSTVVRARDERNPGEFDYEKYLLNKGISAIAVIYKQSDIEIISGQVNRLSNAIFSIRKSIDEKINSLHNKTTAGLLRGLILGDRSMIDGEIQTGFINAGVVHVLSVSGLHVGFIILLFVFFFQRLNIYARFIFTLIGLTAYVMITNYQPPVTRAAIMGTAILFTPIAGRNTNSINSLALAAFVILLFNPKDLFNPGFQLSFAAILAIIIFYPSFSNRINNSEIKSGLIKKLLLFSAVSLAAQIGTLPFTLVYFHKFSLVSILANLVVIPLSGFIVQLGIFTVFVGYLWNSFAYYFASSNELLTYFLFLFVDFMGSLGLSFVRINAFSLFDGLVFYSILFFVFFIWEKLNTAKSKTAVIILSTFVLIALVKLDDHDLLPGNKLSVVAIDVGQGDSFLIKFPNGKHALIDAGEANRFFDNGSKVIIPLLERLGIDAIDYGFITHIDSDHFMGYYSLIKQGFIKQIFKPQLDSTLEKDLNLEKFIKSNGLRINYYSKRIICIGNTRIYILNDTVEKDFLLMSTNDKSGMIKLVYGNTGFLFTGDAGIKAEKFYENLYGKFLKSDLLKAAHHGSKTSSSEGFINLVKPRITVISAGVANKFKHPHKEIIDRFNEIGSKILRTDFSGAIIMQSDGVQIKNINWKKEQSRFIF